VSKKCVVILDLNPAVTGYPQKITRNSATAITSNFEKYGTCNLWSTKLSTNEEVGRALATTEPEAEFEEEDTGEGEPENVSADMYL
jgi:hypothetical protein